MLWTWPHNLNWWPEVWKFCFWHGWTLCNSETVKFWHNSWQCRGDELKSPIEHYKLIQERDFINYKMEVNNAAIASTIESERHDLHIEKNLVEKSVLSNGFCLKKHKNWKNWWL